ncbi:MAG: PE family protein [Mycobacterium sp.]|uniref:PE family protein n=1 Tax=Mycobacterium sp. TaxID=1785 RepID=UPI003C4C11B3
MSYVIASPEMMTAAATDLATIGSDLSTAHAAAAVSTVALVPAAADEVSAGIAHLFSRYAEDFQGLAGKAAASHEQFVQHLTAGAHSYASAEAINVSYLLWLAENAGLYTAVRTLFEMLQSNSIFFQILQFVLEPVRALLGGFLILLFFAAIGILELLNGFLGKFGV